MNEGRNMSRGSGQNNPAEAPKPGKSTIIRPPRIGIRKEIWMSRIDHPMPRWAESQVPQATSLGDAATHRAGNTGLHNGQMHPRAPFKKRAFDSYEPTGTPQAAENPTANPDISGPRHDATKKDRR
jgi:hypothetical protein